MRPCKETETRLKFNVELWPASEVRVGVCRTHTGKSFAEFKFPLFFLSPRLSTDKSARKSLRDFNNDTVLLLLDFLGCDGRVNIGMG